MFDGLVFVVVDFCFLEGVTSIFVCLSVCLFVCLSGRSVGRLVGCFLVANPVRRSWFFLWQQQINQHFCAVVSSSSKPCVFVKLRGTGVGLGGGRHFKLQSRTQSLAHTNTHASAHRCRTQECMHKRTSVPRTLVRACQV